ncbi:unnamed protein product, partial [Iphiclides podalirius]
MPRRVRVRAASARGPGPPFAGTRAAPGGESGRLTDHRHPPPSGRRAHLISLAFAAPGSKPTGNCFENS